MAFSRKGTPDKIHIRANFGPQIVAAPQGQYIPLSYRDKNNANRLPPKWGKSDRKPFNIQEGAVNYIGDWTVTAHRGLRGPFGRNHSYDVAYSVDTPVKVIQKYPRLADLPLVVAPLDAPSIRVNPDKPKREQEALPLKAKPDA